MSDPTMLVIRVRSKQLKGMWRDALVMKLWDMSKAMVHNFLSEAGGYRTCLRCVGCHFGSRRFSPTQQRYFDTRPPSYL